MFGAFIIQNLWVCTYIYNVYSSLAARMCNKKCAAQAASAVYVWGGLGQVIGLSAAADSGPLLFAC